MRLPLRVSSHRLTPSPVADCSCLLLDACWRVLTVEVWFSVVPFQPQPWAGSGLCLGSWVFSNRDLRVWIQLLPWEFRLSSLPFLQRQCVFACALGVKVLLACPQWLNALFGEKRYGCDLMLFPQLLSHPSSSFEHGGRFSLDFLLVPLFMRVWWLHVRQAGTWGPLLQCGNA